MDSKRMRELHVEIGKAATDLLSSTETNDVEVGCELAEAAHHLHLAHRILESQHSKP